MSWKSTCTLALQKAGLFQDSHHLSRFKELVDCYRSYPFFTKGLCKCMYLSAWDEEHFCIMLETLAELTLGRERNTSEMKSKGACLAEASDCREYGPSLFWREPLSVPIRSLTRNHSTSSIGGLKLPG